MNKIMKKTDLRNVLIIEWKSNWSEQKVIDMYLNVLNVSSKLMSAGLMAAIMAVFELPPVLK